MIRTTIAFLIVSFCVSGQQADREETLEESLRRGFAAIERSDYRLAEPEFQQSLEIAVALGNRRAQAEALRGLGRVSNARGNYTQARAFLTQAIAIFAQDSRHSANLAQARNDLAYTEWATGNYAGAAALYREAFNGARAAGDKAEMARIGYNLAFTTRPGPERLARIAEVLDAANETGNARLAGKATHLWGDTLYTTGQLRGAIEKLNQALVLLARPQDRGDRARVLISLGRVYGAHLRHDVALGYCEQALSIHRELGDKQAAVYALNSIAVAHRALGHWNEASAAGVEAISIARQTGARNLLAGTLTNQAKLRLARGDYQAALDLLHESIRLYPKSMGREYLAMTEACVKLGRKAEALEAAQQAVQHATKIGDPHFQGLAHYWRAQALDADGRGAEAEADVRKALEIAEKLRAQIVPTDFLKRGYAELWSALIDFAVDLFTRRSLYEEALTAAEQGRARAFVDLLATRWLMDSVAREDVPAAATQEPRIASFAAVPFATAAGIREAAQRTRSAVLIYWVTDNATFVWLVAPSGNITAARLAVGAARLSELVRAAARPSLRARPTSSFAGLRTRGEQAPLVATGGPGDPYRELYRLLLDPIAKQLPAPPSSLTVVAHGPLHRVSFAGLRSPAGRYLIENYSIGYSPTATPGAQPAAQPQRRQYLFVADPVGVPAAPDGRPLPALSGARRESSAAAKILRGRNVTLMAGTGAGEAAVRQRLPEFSVIHFATHGFLIDGKPFDSFLALGRRSSASGDDGKLTTGEIYDLKLHADLVVLSACRTADGPVTGDGIVGMSRAFFYAGAGRVLATLWDVADVPTERLISRFYLHAASGAVPREALRVAQLDLLAALRKGRVRVNTPLGTVSLPEHPMFWAGFVMLNPSL